MRCDDQRCALSLPLIEKSCTGQIIFVVMVMMATRQIKFDGDASFCAGQFLSSVLCFHLSPTAISSTIPIL